MTIIIPSKHIYDIDNSKILSNNIDKINTQRIDYSLQSSDSNIYVLEKNITDIEIDDTALNNRDMEFSPLHIDKLNNVDFKGVESRVEYNSLKYITCDLYIPIYRNNKESVANPNKISVRITGQINIGQVASKIKYEYYAVPDVSGGYVVHLNPQNEAVWLYGDIIDTNDTDYTIPTELIHTATYGDLIAKVTQVLSSDDNTNSYKVEEVIHNNIECFHINLKILCGIRTITANSNAINPLNYIGIETIPTDNKLFITIPFTGEYMEYIPKKVTILVDGLEQSISEVERNISVGDGNKDMKLDSNELFQANIEQGLNNIIDKWENGRETATIVCGIADYYDDLEYVLKMVGVGSAGTYNYSDYISNYPLNVKVGDKIKVPPNYEEITVLRVLYGGLRIRCNSPYDVKLPHLDESFVYSHGNKIIDINSSNMSFKLHQEVIPYVYKSLGVDVPMSLKKNCEPKVFEIVGREIYDEGVPFQKLTLLEV